MSCTITPNLSPVMPVFGPESWTPGTATFIFPCRFDELILTHSRFPPSFPRVAPSTFWVMSLGEVLARQAGSMYFKAHRLLQRTRRRPLAGNAASLPQFTITQELAIPIESALGPSPIFCYDWRPIVPSSLLADPSIDGFVDAAGHCIAAHVPMCTYHRN